MVSCKLCHASQGSSESIKHNLLFHTIPDHPTIKEKWLQFILSQVGKEKFKGVCNIKRVRLCSRHFERRCYSINQATGRLKLTPLSIPTVSYHRPTSQVNKHDLVSKFKKLEKNYHKKSTSSFRVESADAIVTYPRFIMEPISSENSVINEPVEVIVDEMIVDSNDVPIKDLMYTDYLSPQVVEESNETSIEDNPIPGDINDPKLGSEYDVVDLIDTDDVSSEYDFAVSVGGTAGEATLPSQKAQDLAEYVSAYHPHEPRIATCDYQKLKDLTINGTLSKENDSLNKPKQFLKEITVDPIYISSDEEEVVETTPIILNGRGLMRSFPCSVEKYRIFNKKYFSKYKKLRK